METVTRNNVASSAGRQTFPIMGTDNCPLYSENVWGDHIAQVLSELFGKKIEFDSPEDDKFWFRSPFTLTYPERFALEILNRYFDSYSPGIRREGGRAAFPTDLAVIATPFEWESEAEAYEAAEVLQDVFDLVVDVTATGTGYAVVIEDGGSELTGDYCERLAGVCMVLRRYSVARKPNAWSGEGDNDRDHMAWQKRIGERYTQQQRIEDGINAILAHLGHPEAKGGENVPPASQNRERGIEALIPSSPAKPAAKSGKSSAKRSYGRANNE